MKRKKSILGLVVVVLSVVFIVLIWFSQKAKDKNDDKQEKLASINVNEDNNDKLKDVVLLSEEEIAESEKQTAKTISEIHSQAFDTLDLNDSSISPFDVDESFDIYCEGQDGYIYYNMISRLSEKYSVDINKIVLNSFYYDENVDLYFYVISINDEQIKVFIDNDNVAYLMEI